MPPRILFRSLVARAFRNLTELVLEPSPRLNVVSGDNGQGKTSLLEALYVVATTRSFRADKLLELVQEGAELASVRATVSEGAITREQRVTFGARARTWKLDDKRPPTLAAYATRTPVIVFHPGDLALASGPASVRRLLLDRVALFADPASGDDRARFTRATRERQRVLEERGVRAPELEVYERLMAEHGARLARARARAAASVGAALAPAFASMASPALHLTVGYEPGGAPDAADFERELASRRAVDLRRGSASYGPQRDELALCVDGRSARRHASQGQQRILALALKVAELACVRAARGAEPVLLLDDVSSELDPARTGAVYDFLRATEGQVFVTTTRPELFVTPELAGEARADFTLAAGRLSRA
ncbi:MAG: DNA replication and repair protein RecF [Sorangiineae bacterium]|nr:DNA replication and repair protein RecF [Polyangiaceae bacterium]MEB2322385.1 DNA replication and repair protein RecF [Sorangiineae bacterium]